MKKPYWLKKIFLKYYITNCFFFIFSLFIKPKGEKNKILITEFDGIGDVVVHQKLINLIIEKHGYENVIFLVKENMGTLVKLLDVKYETYIDGFHMNIINLMKIYKKLCNYNFKELYFLEFHLGYNVNDLVHSDKENKVNFLKKFKFEKIYGYENGFYKNWIEKFNIVLVESKFHRIIDKVYNFAKKIDPNIKKEMLIPDLPIIKTDGDYITVGVGAADSNRIISPKKMIIFLEYIIKKEKNIKIHMLGYGNREKEYCDTIIKALGHENIVDYVNKLDLGESAKMIANSKLYIGFDSGLYNISYALRKKTIGIFSRELKPFQHEAEYVKIIEKDESSIDELITDDYYKNELMNSISLSSFQKAYSYFYPI